MLVSLGLVTLGTLGVYLWRFKKRQQTFVLDGIEETLHEKVVIVTGANSGIGYETALELARRGAILILACRDLPTSASICVQLKKLTKNEQIFVEHLDLASFQAVKSFVQRIQDKYKRVDILINNAGVMACPKSLTVDEFEVQFQVNYLSHFLLTNLLLDQLTLSQSPRVINVISKLYEGSGCHFL
jgi:NAD(P)-dependent dehydrogenase (short-subunit alcohol dehydrogenase family)